MTDETPERMPCGHYHPVNPYVDSDTAHGYHELVMQLHRLTVLTCEPVGGLTAQYVASATACVAGVERVQDDGRFDEASRARVRTTVRGLMWELADLVQLMAGGRETITERNTDSDSDDPDDPSAQLGFSALEAFFHAAAAGQHQRAVNVVEAIYRDSTSEDPELAVVSLFTNAVMSMAKTTRHRVPDGLYLFTP